jgi:hypothetical protein
VGIEPCICLLLFGNGSIRLNSNDILGAALSSVDVNIWRQYKRLRAVACRDPRSMPCITNFATEVFDKRLSTALRVSVKIYMICRREIIRGQSRLEASRKPEHNELNS